MTPVEMLRLLRDAHAFDAVPLRAGLGLTHVPFDDLTGTSTVEAVLTRGLASGERLAVVGRSGSGKSSVIGHVVHHGPPNLAPIRVPVESERDEVVSEPGAFCQHLLQSVVRYLDVVRSLDGKTRAELLASTAGSTELGRTTKGRFGLGLARWMFDAEASRDVESIAKAHVARDASGLIESAREVLQALQARDQLPLLVIDDSDLWLSTAAGNRQRLIAPFFRRVLRTVADELPCGLLVAVHEGYLKHQDFPDGEGVLERFVELPPLPDATAVTSILQARADAVADGVQIPLIVEGPARDVLFDAYQAVNGSVRRMMLLAHAALNSACDDGLDVINERHIQAAAAELT